jgi:flagellar basal-body rod protein FlgG
MSIQALYTAATGMESLQQKLDVIANNLANVNTTAFKQDRANFEDLFYRNEVLPGLQDSNGNVTPTGIAFGTGSRVESTQADFRQGSFQQTGNQYDVAIVGNGFFKVNDPITQSPLYTRAGNFSVNANGQLVIGSATVGRLLEPNITIPSDTTQVSISSQGIVSVQQANNPQMQQVGTITLSRFINPQGLLKVGDNLYQQTDASGNPTDAQPGTSGMGTLQQNVLEASNVQPVQQLIDLITTQRSFELNSQAINAGDQILQQIANLRRQ